MKASFTRKKVKEKDYVVEYEFMPSKQSEIRLQRGFEIIFEKIIKMEDYNQTNQKYFSMASQ